MPNFKIFQDVPDRAKVKIYGSNDVALNTTANGDLTITSSGLAIVASDPIEITSTGLAVTFSEPIEVTSTGLVVTFNEPIEVTSTGLVVTFNEPIEVTSTELSTSLNGRMSVSTEEAVAGVTDTTYQNLTSTNVMDYSTWSFAIVNESLAANTQAVLQLQLSPDGTNWVTEAEPVTIDINTTDIIVSSYFLKYARLQYKAAEATSGVTLNVFFQAQV